MSLLAGSSHAFASLMTQHELVTKNYRANAWGLGAELNFFRTTANYSTEGGNFESLEQGKYYQNLQLTGLGYYNLGRRWRAWAGGTFARATSFDSEFERSKNEFKEMQVGTSYILKWNSFFLTPEVFGTYALSEVDPNTDSVLTGEGAHQLLAGMWIWRSFSNIQLFSALHFQYLTDGRSTRLPYTFGASLKFRSFNLFASLNGLESLTDDEKTIQQRRNVTDGVNGGSLRYYAVNPSSMEVRTGVHFEVNRTWGINFGGLKTINGSSSAEGYALFAGIQFKNLGSRSSSSGGKSLSPSNQRHQGRRRLAPEEEFKVKQEEYDESLFQDNLRPKRQAPQTEPVDVNEMLDDAAKDLE